MNHSENRIKSYKNQPKENNSTQKPKEIYTKNMFHASILMQAGASFKYFKKHKKFYYMYLDTSFLDKKSLANKFEAIADDLANKKPLKDILENSVLSQIEHSYYRARNKLNEMIQEERRGSHLNDMIDEEDDYDYSYDDEDDED